MNTLAGVKGQIGEFEYFMVQMSARDLVSKTKVASETDKWLLYGIQEQYQRKLSVGRISKIAKYYANDPQRFSSSLIAVLKEPDIHFWDSVTDNIPHLSAQQNYQLKNHGIFSWLGGELVILDGQHRRVAIEKAIQITEQRLVADAESYDTGYNIFNDTYSLMIIVDKDTDNNRIRKVFNDVNKNAKPTPPRDDIVTNMVDGAAIITRRLMNKDNVFCAKKDLVNWKSNTISVRSPQLTTLSGLYQINRLILAEDSLLKTIAKIRHEKPDDDLVNKGFKLCQEFWSILFEEFEPLKNIQDTNIAKVRHQKGNFQMFYQPQGQYVIVKGLLIARRNSGLSLSVEYLARRLNTIDWSQGNKLWQDIFYNKDRLMRQTTDKDRTARLIACLLLGYEKTRPDFRLEVEIDIRNAKNDHEWKIPWKENRS